MNVERMLSDLFHENEAAVLPLLKKAYDLGYREALASRPVSPVAPGPAVVPPTGAAPVLPDPAPVPPASAPLFSPPAASVYDGVLGPEAPDEPDDEDDGPRPVRGSLTIGGLVKRITRHFGLDRFDIEVRVVDPQSHRHLMRDVRLSRYQLEDK